jgi:putative NIF3 family GTP cyclohydrolase 1 type 2
MDRDELARHPDQLLEISRIRDYCPNVAAGHHATQRFGAQALGEHLAAALGLVHRFIDVDNPV